VPAGFVGLLAAALAAGGCCSPPPPRAEKFFNRETSLDTLKGFVYAVDSYQWDYAYESLCASSKKEIGRLKFEVVIRIATDPVFHEIPVYDIISQAFPDHGKITVEGEKDGDRAWILVIPSVRDSEGTPIHFSVPLSFVKENGEWRFDFLDTVNAIGRAMPPWPEDLSRRGS
jgi:hypothetical protein